MIMSHKQMSICDPKMKEMEKPMTCVGGRVIQEHLL